MESQRPLLAVLIDADNTSYKYAGAIFEEIASFGEAAVRRIYGNFADPRLANWNKVLLEHGLNPQQSPAYTAGKNASDIAMVIDAMDLLHTGRFPGFVLVSSDSDFTGLAARIREQGYDVYGIGKKNTPDPFQKASKRFIFVENLEAGESNDKHAITLERNSKAENPSRAVPLVLKAMKKMEVDGEWYALGPLGSYIRRANPEFDYRTYGCAKLRDLIEKTGQFEVEQQNGQGVFVRQKP